MIKKTIYLFIIALLASSCQQEKSTPYQSILKTAQGDFRSVTIGDSWSAVKNNEKDSFLVDQNDDYLYYEYDINIGNSYTVSYDFSTTNELYEIEVTTYLDEIEDAEILFNDFYLHFSNKYGNPSKENDEYTTWKKHSNNQNQNIEIAMINQSESYGIIIIKVRDLEY